MENPKYKILLVDDDSFLLNMYSLKFTKGGFDAVATQNAHDTLLKLKEGYTPDIIILDIIMPGMDGIALLAEIRKEKYIPNATVIMLTNQSDAEGIEKAKELGINGYIVKATTIPSEVISQVIEIHQKK